MSLYCRLWPVVDVELFARTDSERFSCGLIDGPCPQQGWDARVADPQHGATSIFLGVVRNHNAGESAVAVDYDVHPALAQKALTELCAELTERFPVKLWMIHSRGLVQVGEASVAIAASSAHRRDAITCVSEAIDALKVRVPIWKREIAPDASHRWLDGHSLRSDH